mmetsp:Transcript_3590/g.11232  ORF Transcript_3590/g.11232 Transcript_3590/m.11232 type:complete len:201 (+) Transcript_3590:380-982(+)
MKRRRSAKQTDLCSKQGRSQPSVMSSGVDPDVVPRCGREAVHPDGDEVVGASAGTRAAQHPRGQFVGRRERGGSGCTDGGRARRRDSCSCRRYEHGGVGQRGLSPASVRGRQVPGARVAVSRAIENAHTADGFQHGGVGRGNRWRKEAMRPRGRRVSCNSRSATDRRRRGRHGRSKADRWRCHHAGLRNQRIPRGWRVVV